MGRADVLMTESSDSALKQKIRSVFHSITIYADFKKVKGATVREIKDRLRGSVPQDQKKFVKLMDSLGLVRRS